MNDFLNFFKNDSLYFDSGVVCGLGLRHYEPSQFIINIIAYPGELFMRLLKLMILPLVIASLITGKKSRFLQI